MSDAHIGRNRRRTRVREWRKLVAERAGMTAGSISAMERGAQGDTQDGLEARSPSMRSGPTPHG